MEGFLVIKDLLLKGVERLLPGNRSFSLPILLVFLFIFNGMAFAQKSSFIFNGGDMELNIIPTQDQWAGFNISNHAVMNQRCEIKSTLSMTRMDGTSFGTVEGVITLRVDGTGGLSQNHKLEATLPNYIGWQAQQVTVQIIKEVNLKIK